MQQGRTNPLFSRLGCASTIVMVLVLGGILRYFGGGPFSPGQLSAASPQQQPLGGYESHAEFEEKCELCHVAWQGVSAEHCQECHEEVTLERMNEQGIHGRLPDTEQCVRCHTEHNGREMKITHYDLTTFEHDWLTSYSLGKHQTDYAGLAMACDRCHLPGRFDAARVDCLDCHQEAEPAFIADHLALYGDGCQSCHDGQDTMANFDHRTVFPLEGAHFVLGCDECHESFGQADISPACSGCHEEPAIHAGEFGLDCARCHTATGWRPAYLSYHTFPLDHGEEGKIACQTCHTQTYQDYTCTNCHAHDPIEIREEHLEEGIDDFVDCVACHPIGHEAETDD